jgi:FMN phosphatase YigB (HAD superfamily)
VETSSPSQVRVVVFDLGKVLLEFDYRIAARRFLSRCRIGMGQILRLVNQSSLLLDYERGRLTTDQFFAIIREATGFEGSRAEFARIFGDIFTPIAPMVELFEQIRDRGYPAYIFSNTNELATDHIRNTYPFFNRFTGYVLSYEHGVMKPDARLYEVLEETAGVSGGAIFYLDDRPENVEAGRRRRWRAFVHESPQRSRESAVHCGLLS